MSLQYPFDDHDKCDTFERKASCEAYESRLVEKASLCEWRKVDTVLGEEVMGCVHIDTEEVASAKVYLLPFSAI